MSAYQIKHTPYFRRMFNNSRRNGQLQRLREEYERIQEFNDRTIELKMRQVRLRRLFRYIEDINQETTATPMTTVPGAAGTQAHSLRRRQTLLPLTPEEQHALIRRQRLTALERGRELGQEISRRNAQLAETGGGFYLRSELRPIAKLRAADEARTLALERRQRAARRISYGNEQSRSNIERIVRRRQRQRAIVNATPSASLMRNSNGQQQQQQQLAELHPDLVKRAMLQHRLEYGNSRSSNNLNRPIGKLATAGCLLNCISTTDAKMAQEEEQQLQLLSLSAAPYNNNNNSGNVVNVDAESDMQTASEQPDDNVPTTSKEASMSDLSARHRWHCISLPLPWVKSLQKHPVAEQRATNISITIGNDETANISSPQLTETATGTGTGTGTTDGTYQSIREPSLLQEDLLHIMELDNGFQVPKMYVMHHKPFDQ
ncbi:uncharacterized protein LOC6566138 [Drosophila grimshawi]|uniref:GH24610 n=1 Tax=Drosophila grimshawi TaxID=7222 RepID=B4JMA8_DROGR|nr:uncharacterized protein LOC6566138 [Drosophila grimshawi]EDV91869.1 GH24610 [Drosophila grimshawi]